MIHEFTNARLRHGDVMDSEGIAALMAGNKVDIIYTDPPWGLGNLSYWQTINKRMTGAEPKPVDYTAFINQIFSIGSTYCTGLMFVEYGIKWRDDIKTMAASHGFLDLGTIPLRYRSGSKLLPLDLHIFCKTKGYVFPDGYYDQVKDTYGPATLKAVTAAFLRPGMKVLDPCCGMGYTAQLAKDNQCFFFGNELNAARLAKTIKRFQ